MDEMEPVAEGPRSLGEEPEEEGLEQGEGKNRAASGSVVEDTSNSIFGRIQKMKEQQAELKRQRKEGQKELKNLERKRKRLSAKAKLLSDEDLLQVLTLRREAKAMSKPSSSSRGDADASKPSPAKS